MDYPEPGPAAAPGKRGRGGGIEEPEENLGGEVEGGGRVQGGGRRRMLDGGRASRTDLFLSAAKDVCLKSETSH